MSLTKLSTNMLDFAALVAGGTVTFSNTVTTNNAVFSNTTSFAGSATFGSTMSITGTLAVTGTSTFTSVIADSISTGIVTANVATISNLTANNSNGINGQVLFSSGSSSNVYWGDATFMVHPFTLIGM